MAIEAINPATGETIKTYKGMAAAELTQVIDSVHVAYEMWRRFGFAERAKYMREAAKILESDAAAYGRLIADEMGKPIRDGIAEAKKCASGCTYYADNAENILAPERVEGVGRKSFIAFNPIGIVLAVMPWNFPFWQVFRAAAPALMAGNAMVLKHASNVPGCALAIEEVFKRAGFPENLFRTLMIGSRDVAHVIEHKHVRAVTLTGSGDAGKAVAAKAGSLLKKTVLELGGSDPYLILEDADMELAAKVCTKGRLVNSGQSCIAAKRFIVVEKVRAEFEAAFVNAMGAAKMGDPLSETSEIGPQARHDLRDTLHEQVTASIAKGAKCLLGGKVPDDRGAYYPPTILTNVTPGMPAYDEELFGPVASVIIAKDEADAIRIANDSSFGLGGGVLTRDLARGERIATEEIESGSVFVNDAVRSDPRLPFGGIKDSGYGRELSSYGLKEFVNIKSVVVA